MTLIWPSKLFKYTRQLEQKMADRSQPKENQNNDFSKT